MTVVIAGADPDGLGEALADAGAAVARAEGTATADDMKAAGIADADALVVTDVGLATSIPVARELNPDVRVVVYARGSVPDFAVTAADLIVDPDLMDAGTVAAELVA